MLVADSPASEALSVNFQEEKVSFSGDMPEEPLDIADEMEKIGKDIDPEHPKPLGED